MKRFPWLKMRKKTDPELPMEPPMWFGDISNGEYFRFATKKDRKIRKMILNTADENARYLGVDRRQFLASACGMATTLWTLGHVAACSSDDKAAGNPMNVPKDAMVDEDLACSILRGDEFIFDVQTHWFKKEDLTLFPLYLQLFGAIFNIATEDNYIRWMFCESDTHIAALTAWPGVACTNNQMANCGLPLSNESNAASRDKINQLAGGAKRVVNHMQVMVQDPNGVEFELDLMDQAKATYGLAAWKMYPGFMPIFKLDDERGRAVIEHGLKLGTNLFCVHKGLPIGPFFDYKNGNLPNDVGPVAKDYKDANFVIYHSAIIAGSENANSAPPEGAYDPNDPDPKGVNTLIRTLEENGIGPGGNVYGEVGSAINQVQNDPVQAAHFFGKLLKHLGPDNVVWGTDCVIYGSPQPFIEWFRNLEIPQSMQEEYGYPALDKAQKEKILGKNAAKLYGIDCTKTLQAVESCPSAMMKKALDEEIGPRRWSFQQPQGPQTWEEYVLDAKEAQAKGIPG